LRGRKASETAPDNDDPLPRHDRTLTTGYVSGKTLSTGGNGDPGRRAKGRPKALDTQSYRDLFQRSFRISQKDRFGSVNSG
jgi:hypothetical protein